VLTFTAINAFKAVALPKKIKRHEMKEYTVCVVGFKYL